MLARLVPHCSLNSKCFPFFWRVIRASSTTNGKHKLRDKPRIPNSIISRVTTVNDTESKFRDLYNPNCQLIDLAELFHGFAIERSSKGPSFWNSDRIGRFGEVLKTMSYSKDAPLPQYVSRPKYVNGKHLSMLLYGLRGNMFRNCSNELSSVVELINTHILSPLVNKNVELGQPLTTRQVVMMLFSLQHMKIGVRANVHYLRYLRLLLRVLDQGYTSTQSGGLTAQNICNLMCNLQNLSSNVDEVKTLLQFVARFIHVNVSSGKSSAVFAPEHIGNSLYGLREMSSSCLEVTRLLDVLVENSIIDYDLYLRRNGTQKSKSMAMKELSTALYGMQGLSLTGSPSCAVAKFIDRSIQYLNTCNDSGGVTSQSIGNSVYGLRHMLKNSSDGANGVQTIHKNTMEGIYRLLAQQFTTPAGSENMVALTAQNASSAMYGLNNSYCTESSDSAEIRTLVGVLAKRIAVVPAATTPDLYFTPFQVSNALYGMRNMSSAVPEVQALLESLLFRLSIPAASALSLDSRHFSVSLYGMRNMMAHHPCVEAMLQYLHSQYATRGVGAVPDFQFISNSLIGIQKLSCEVPVAGEIVKTVLIPKLQELPVARSLPQITPGLASQVLSSTLYSLYNKEDKDARVLNLLALISNNLVPALLMASNQPTTGTDAGLFRSHQAIAASLFGLQRCSSESSEGRELIMILADHIRSYLQSDAVTDNTEIEPRHVAMMLYGCRYFHYSHNESQQLFSSIIPLISLSLVGKDQAPGVLSLYQLCRCFYGVQSLVYVPMNKVANDNTVATLSLLLLWFKRLNVLSVEDTDSDWGSERGSLASAEELEYMDEEVEEDQYRQNEAGIPRRRVGDAPTRHPVDDIQKSMDVGLASLRSSLEDGEDAKDDIPNQVRLSTNGGVSVSPTGNCNMLLAQERKSRQKLNDLLVHLQKELVLYIAYRE